MQAEVTILDQGTVYQTQTRFGDWEKHVEGRIRQIH